MELHSALVASHRLNCWARRLGAIALVFMLFIAALAGSSEAFSDKPKIPGKVAENSNAIEVPDRVLGDANAPVTIEEYASLTCPHCADFYTQTLPEIEKRYVSTGKVRLIFRDFPLDRVGLQAAALARCMPKEQFYPFIATLYQNQMAWAMSPSSGEVLMQYAKLGGLSPEKAKSCLTDNAMFDSIIAISNRATEKYNVTSTPIFILNGGIEKIEGAKSLNEFSAAIERLLAVKKK